MAEQTDVPSFLDWRTSWNVLIYTQQPLTHSVRGKSAHLLQFIIKGSRRIHELIIHVVSVSKYRALDVQYLQVKSMSFVSWNTSVNWLSSPLQYIVPLHYLTMCNAVYIIVVRSIISYNYTSQVLYIWPQLCSYSKTVFVSAIYTNIWASYSGFTRFCWSGYGSVTIKNLDSWYFFCEQNTTGDVARCAKQQVNFLATCSRFRRSWRRFFKQKRWKAIWWGDFIKLENP